MGIPVLRARGKLLRDKKKPYECGFKPFDNARSVFDVRFALVAILFIVFDVEIVLLIPWALSIREISPGAMFSVFCFLATLTVGLIYEWKKGLLEWN